MGSLLRRLDIKNVYVGIPVLLTFMGVTWVITSRSDAITNALIIVQLICLRIMFGGKDA